MQASLHPEKKREAFTEATNAYLQSLQSIDVRLRRQIYGLEEANIIPPEKLRPIATNKSEVSAMPIGYRGPPQGRKEEDDSGAGGVKGGESGLGIGSLDIGLLNSKSGRVGREMEAELWGKARKYLEDRQGSDRDSKELRDASSGGDVHMRD